MKKKIATMLCFGMFALLVGACSDNGTKENVTQEIFSIEEKEVNDEIAMTETGVPSTDTESTTQQEMENESVYQEENDEFSFSNLVGQNFVFSSGAGAWATMLKVKADGSFFGEYSDSDMGDIGEDYPNGKVYQCFFSGKFSMPEKINDYTYSVQIENIEYEKEAGTEEISDGMLFHYTDPYGLEETNSMYIYLPGTPLAELSEDLRIWLGYYDLSTVEETELPFYALCNPIMQEGFVGYDTIEGTKNNITYTKEASDLLKNAIENEPLNQNELNAKSQDLFEMWDRTLNMLWETLEATLDDESMEELRIKQREWITEKERAMEEAGAEVEGGSMQPMVMNLRAAALTEERVYELMELLK